MAEQYSTVNLKGILDLLMIHAEMVAAPSLSGPICVDPDDDKFLACAVASKAHCVISGDKHLLQVAVYQGIRVLKPREFVDEYLVCRGKR